MRSSARWWLLAATGLALIALIASKSDSFWGTSVDTAHHYSLVDYITAHLRAPDSTVDGLGEMAKYPPASHALAAVLGALVGSLFLGMHLVAITSVLVIWLALTSFLVLLHGPGRWLSAATFVAVMVFVSPIGPLPLQLHGFEIIGNFFFAQVVAQAIFWVSAVAITFGHVRRVSYLDWALPTAVVVGLLTWVHLLPATELLVLLGLMSVPEIVRRWRRHPRMLRHLAAPISLPLFAAMFYLGSPSFRASREIAENDGYLLIPHMPNWTQVAALAALVLITSALMAWWGRGQVPDGPVVVGISAAGAAIAITALVQAILLLIGEGTPYAVKKYGFGLLTVLVLQASILAGLLLASRLRVRGSRRAAWPVGASLAGALTVVAFGSVLSHPPASSTAQVTALERQLDRLEDVALGDSETKRNYAWGLPNSNPVFDYMFSISTLRAGRYATNEIQLSAVLEGRSIPRNGVTGHVVTGAGSELDAIECRSLGPLNGVVVVEFDCAGEYAWTCLDSNTLGLGGAVRESQLAGFSVAEAQGRWTDGEVADFKCQIDDTFPADRVRVTVNYLGTFPQGSVRPVVLEIGGTAEEFLASGSAPGAVSVSVPSPSTELAVQLRVPGVQSPTELGLGNDERQLGVYVTSIDIATAEVTP